ncbi:DNA polymerase III subunit gamma/tau [Undibacterium sp. CY7W]|uniref:DNA polymerase III subunit gamma/tau n=1 Tax=Undibacterium rugosum TaxID=2762291 RepID=A0A923I0W1_9BURK|nr:DNA polymerase III subunit gamma/tau [Undibacterium rugosum]MBC3934982.1 DNA polymerase III subunit gamma/tau [Undibacterium rugosum]
MSYQVLARKYRPKSFETLVGQEHVVRALTHALEQQRLHHAYLFTGTRGVGKTTLSRILAKSFNCEKGITAQPCGVCEACTAIDAGRFVDYIEMDAASNRGVDEMASLLEQAIYAPSNARFKVYMIDEVHMLTNHAFNAMLKTLEEPPEHVKFILATTDPQKIPVTVLSRCLQFNLKQMPPGHIVGHLENILGQEQIAFEAPALRLLAQGAHGSMRDALSLTDQAIAYAAGKVSLEAVQGMLGALDQSYLIRLLDALSISDGKALLDVADEMAARSLSYKSALQDLGSLLHQLAVAQMVPSAVPDDIPEREHILRLALQFSKEQVQLFYQIAVHGKNELALAPDEYAGFSMTLLRMLAFHPIDGSGLIPASSPTPAAPTAPSGSGPAAGARAASPAQAALRAAQPGSGGAAVANLVAPSAARTAVPVQAPVAPGANSASSLAPSLAPSAISATTTAASAAVTAAAGSAAAKPMSPAMAALAAARAASAKPGAAKNTAPEAVVATPQAPAVTAVQPVAIVTPAAAPIPAPLPVKPAVAAATVVQAAAPAPNLPSAPLTAQQIEASAQPVGLDDMPPPWDDDPMFAAAQPAARPAPRPIRSAPAVSMQPAPQVQADSAPEEAPLVQPTVLEPLADDRVLWRAPVAALSWDGHWPDLAASLPVRGVAQQLAQQSELINCREDGNAFVFQLRVPVATLLSAGSLDKLSAALSERFGKTVRVEHQIGAVELTANAQAIAQREVRQQQAEQAIQNDGFVQSLMREFGASIVTGSVRPA